MITALKYARPLEALDPFKCLCCVVGPPYVGTTRYFWKVPIMLVRFFKKKLTDIQTSAQICKNVFRMSCSPIVIFWGWYVRSSNTIQAYSSFRCNPSTGENLSQPGLK